MSHWQISDNNKPNKADRLPHDKENSVDRSPEKQWEDPQVQNCKLETAQCMNEKQMEPLESGQSQHTWKNLWKEILF